MARSIFLLLIFSTVLYIYGALGCTEFRVRKEIRDLSPDELNRFHLAVKTLHNRSQGQTFSVWDMISKLHLANVPFAHG